MAVKGSKGRQSRGYEETRLWEREKSRACIHEYKSANRKVSYLHFVRCVIQWNLYLGHIPVGSN